jgi:tRNA pseudouridine13 synthase
MEEAARFLTVGRGTRTLRFVNYFGEQRFGSARHGRGFAARHLIRGEFEQALKLLIATPSRKDSSGTKLVKRTIEANWRPGHGLASVPSHGARQGPARLTPASQRAFRSAFAALPSFIRRMTVEAYQSWLWNEIARRVVVERCPPPFIAVSTPFGRLAFPRASHAPGPIVDLAIPLLSSRSALEEPWRSAAEEVLDAEGIAVGDLRIPGLREPYFGEVPRTVFVDATEFSLGPFEPDESMEEKRMFKRRLRFFLPRGSYATVLLRVLGAETRGSS